MDSLTIHFAAMYVSEIWYSWFRNSRGCYSESEMLYGKTRALVSYDRIVTSPKDYFLQ